LRIAIDASYSLGPGLSGVGIYSRQLIAHLLDLHPEQDFRLCYRPHRFFAGLQDGLGRRAGRALLTERGPIPGACLLHGLNQRLPAKRQPRSIATFHDLFVMTGAYSTPEFRERFTAQARHAAAAADLIIAVSAFTASQVTGLLDVPECRVRVIPHGATPAPAVVDAGRREPLILFVGALQKRKNVVRLIRAFEQTPPEWRLMLVGSRGYAAEEVDAAIAGSPRRSGVVVAGYLPDAELERLWTRASIFAFPSLDEGFGMPILDAMARGVPVLTSRRSATAEVAGDAALLIDPENSEEMVDALRTLCTDDRLRDDLVARGRQRAAQFPWRAAAEKTWLVYRELL
jgi:glycosyltransferase involved in cell wall biosynthesis